MEFTWKQYDPIATKSKYDAWCHVYKGIERNSLTNI